MENKIFTKLIMDSGKEYFFNQHPDEVLKRMVNSETDKPYEGFVFLRGLSINPSHISSIEDIDTNKEEIPLNVKFYRAL